MRLFQRVFAAFISVLLLVSFVSCGEEEISADSALERLIGKEALASHQTRLEENETPYTLCFQNKDASHSIYVFSTPISFFEEDGTLSLIDTELVSVSHKESKEGYWKKTKNSPVESYFPKSFDKAKIQIRKGEESLYLAPLSPVGNAKKSQAVQDEIGRWVPAASYEAKGEAEYTFLPTATGVTAVVTWNQKPKSNQISFVISGVEKKEAENGSHQYLLFSAEESAIFHNSYISDSQGNVSFGNAIEFSSQEEKTTVTVTLPQDFLEKASYPITFRPSLEWVSESKVDATLYESDTAALPNASVIPTCRSEWGTNPQHYMKFSVNTVCKTYQENVKQASLHLFALEGKEAKGELQRVRNHWKEESLQNETPIPYQRETELKGSGNSRIQADVTEFIRDCVHDDTYYTEAYGLVWLPSETSDSVLTSYDHARYQSYLRLDLWDAPWVYEK